MAGWKDDCEPLSETWRGAVGGRGALKTPLNSSEQSDGNHSRPLGRAPLTLSLTWLGVALSLS